MKGYKAFWLDEEGNYCTGGFAGSEYTIWEFNETKEVEGPSVLCYNGFHFFKEENFCFGFNFFKSKTDNTRICEVEVLGDIIEDIYKCVTNKIKLIRDVTDELINKVDKNHNSGDYNIGNHNSGNYNLGNYNIGNHNTGDYNLGNYNIGNYNTGNYNTGNYNTGNYNTGNYNTGLFNTDEPKMRMFNKETNMTYSEWVQSDLYICFDTNITGKTYKEVWKEWWKDNKLDDMIERIKRLPNFDKNIFYKITGINIDV